jgi:dolichol-phosphate mannosyltransferase
MFSIIIPTYNEKDNLIRLLKDIKKYVNYNHEVIVVDDASSDGTPEIAEKTGARVLKRPAKLGAASAVLDGFTIAEGDVIGAMDADLSHPAHVLPEIFKQFPENDFVVASRYTKGGAISGWPLWRKIISFGATLMARPLVRIKDPMSGFFFLKKELLPKTVKTTSCKICLELLVKGNYRVSEVPYIFIERVSGKTKMTKMHFPNYIRHILELYAYKLKN